MTIWGVTAFFFIGFMYSVWLRVNRYRQSMPIEPKISPVSLAIQDLIAIAGGIYLSLIMLVSFLKFPVPEKIHLGTVELDPLALFSICLGIVQPIVTNFIKKVR